MGKSQCWLVSRFDQLNLHRISVVRIVRSIRRSHRAVVAGDCAFALPDEREKMFNGASSQGGSLETFSMRSSFVFPSSWRAGTRWAMTDRFSCSNCSGDFCKSSLALRTLLKAEPVATENERRQIRRWQTKFSAGGDPYYCRVSAAAAAAVMGEEEIML